MSIRIKGKKEKRPFLRRAAMSVLAALLALTVQTVWADTYPEYITDIIVVGGSTSEVNSAKSSHSDYTFINTDLNKGCGQGTDDIYIGYKKSSRASTNGGYITNIVITDQSGCPADKTFNGKTYHCAPRYGGSWFTNSVYGDLNSGAGGKDIHVYYTKEEFNDHRVVSGISIKLGEKSYTGCLRWNDNTTGDYADLNAGAGGEYIYMQLTFTTPKKNRPASDPTMKTGLVYNGSAQQLVNYNPTSQCTMYYRIGTSCSYTSTVSDVTATTPGSYTVYYYAGSNNYGAAGPEFYQTVNIAKSPNSGVTVSCPEVIEGTALQPVTGGTNLSTGTITYKYSTSQNGTYSTTAPTAVGTYWVKATVAGDNNCYEYTTAAVSFKILPDWALHNTGDSEADAYVISSPQELDLLSQRVAAGIDYRGKYFRLGNDITYSHTSAWNNTTNTENNYTPIGIGIKYFKGNFDGKGYTVSGIRVSSSNQYCGLFGRIYGSSVKNVILSDARIKNTSTDTDSYCGGIVGHSQESSVTNCWVKSNVCIGGYSYVGGISGLFSGNTLSGCRSEATLTASSSTSNRFGGISGSMDADSNVKHCIVDGATIPRTSSLRYYGAVVGMLWSGTLTNNYYANCSVAGVTDATNVGCNKDKQLADRDGARHAVSISAASGVTITPTGTATNYNVSGITAYDGNNVISCGGKLYSGATEQVNLSANYSATYEYYIINGYTDGHGNALTKNDNGTYTLAMTTAAATVTPDVSLVWGTADGADGTQAHPYLISTVAELNLLAEKVNAGKSFLGKYFRLMADIEYDSSVENNFTPIGFGGDAVFSGYFDGNGYCVSGLNVNMTIWSYIGLFGDASGACIINTVLSGCSFNGRNYVGGIVGKMTSGTLSNCLVLNTKITCPNTCGLIAGSFSGTLSNNFYDELSELNSHNGIGNGVNPNNNDNASFGIRIMCADGVTIEPAEDVLGGYESGFKIYSSGLMFQNVCYKKPLSTVTLHITYSGTIEQDHVLEGFKAYGAIMSEASGSDNYSVSLPGMTDCVIEPYIAIQYWTGAGTENDPYLITSIAGMSHLAEEVNNGNTYENKHFALGKNLEYDRSVENNFEPVGNLAHFFKGSFDGRGHTISGVNVKRPADISRAVGIFGFVQGTSGNRRYIRNLTVVNSSFVSTNRDDVAAICGYSSYADIENCHVGDDVYVSGRSYVGGIVGRLYGYAAGCSCGATVVAQKNFASGICGYNYDTVKDCIYYGNSVTANYIGAIVGYLYEFSTPVVNNSYYTAYGIGGVRGADTDGARFAIATKSKPSNIGSATKTYGTGSYTGITVYENALCYNGIYYWYDENLVVLGNEDAGNDELVKANTTTDNRNVVLAGRTLYKDGSWNTICLPFNAIIKGEDHPLCGAVAKTLTNATVNGTTLTLTFGSEVTDWLWAGVPYIIKWEEEGEDIVNPVFTNCQITASTPKNKSFTSEGSTVEFVGTYSPAALAPNTTSNLFLGSGNKLHYPTQEGYKVNACRAYFKISEAGAEQGAGSDAKAAFSTLILDFGDGDIEETATGITTTDCTDYTDSSAFGWYGIDGRPLSGKPTAKGIYIHGGKKVVVE